MPPGGGPPVMHRHAPGEVYRVLSGEFTFYLGHAEEGVRRITAGAGAVVPLAGNTPHTVRNETSEDAVAFVVHAPGPPMEGFSRAAAALAADGPPALEEVLRIARAARHRAARPGPRDAPSPESRHHETTAVAGVRRPPSWGDGESGRRVDRSGGTCAGRHGNGIGSGRRSPSPKMGMSVRPVGFTRLGEWLSATTRGSPGGRGRASALALEEVLRPRPWPTAARRCRAGSRRAGPDASARRTRPGRRRAASAARTSSLIRCATKLPEVVQRASGRTRPGTPVARSLDFDRFRDGV